MGYKMRHRNVFFFKIPVMMNSNLTCFLYIFIHLYKILVVEFEEMLLFKDCLGHYKLSFDWEQSK